MSDEIESGKEVRSEGQRLLREVTSSHTQDEVAASVGCTRANVSYWVNGKTLPGPAARKALSDKYGIPPASWNKLPGGPDAPAIADVMVLRTSADIAGTPTIDLLNERIAKYASMVLAPDAAPEIVLKAGELERKCIDTRRALERDARARESDIVARSPEWADIRRRTITVLAEYPDALRAWTQAMGKLAEEGSPAPLAEDDEEVIE